MDIWLVALLFFAAGGIVFALLGRSNAPRGWRARFALGAAIATAGVVFAAVELHAPRPDESEVYDRPIQVPPPGYATSDACRACHPGEYASWAASYHRTMTQVATPETVLANFDGVVLREGDWTFRLEHEDDALWVEMPDHDWAPGGAHAPRVRRRISIATGSHHMQAYWYSAGNTRALGLLPFIYNRELDGWIPRSYAFIQPHSEPVSELGRWGKVCIECHVTQGRLRPLYDPPGHDTHVAEFGIACEACHGPADEHVAANQSFLRRYRAHLKPGEGDSTMVHPARLPHDRSSEICGQCHSTSVWTSQEAINDFAENGFPYRPGDRLADTKAIVRGKYEWNPPEVQAVLSFQMGFLDNTFWSDGMNRIAGREYNGLIESPCFQRGEMSCLSCHQMHQSAGDERTRAEWTDDQLKPGMRGDLACTQCHQEYEDAALARQHTHHEPGSEGSRCYNCHMPYGAYGLLKAVRTHQVESPATAVSVATGRPNACNQCHLDRSLGWTAERLAEWYGHPVPDLTDDEREVAASVVWLLKGDAGQRALAAWAMGWESALEVSGRHWEGLHLATALDDPYSAVRFIAQRSIRRLPGFSGFGYDFTASEAELQQAKASALDLWRHGSSMIEHPRGPLLVDEHGQPSWESIQRLLAARDDRPMSFAE